LKLKLSRITDGKKIIPEIEGLRFISILLVILSHINNNILRVYPAAYQSTAESRLAIFLEECGAGVNIFFFISGFILAIPFLKARVYDPQKISLKHYYYRRLTRIEPPYIITLIFFLLAVLLILHQPFLYAINHFMISAFYMHNIIYNHISTINPVAWTLEIEVQYYIIFPLMAIALFFKNHLLRRCSLLAFFVLTSIFHPQKVSLFNGEYYLTKSLFAYCYIFVIGIIVADLYLISKNFLSGNKNILFDLLGLTALFFIITLSGFQSLSYKFFIFVCYVVLFAGIFKGRLLNKIFTNKWITIIGGMCYSIYLLHYAVTYFIMQTFTKNLFSYNYNFDMLIQSIIIIPFILIISAIFFVLLERPFMDINWPNRMKRFFQKSYSRFFLPSKIQSN
jgi:peptidoglycan/LPS O-acetylase OafA/YrhL